MQKLDLSKYAKRFPVETNPTAPASLSILSFRKRYPIGSRVVPSQHAVDLGRFRHEFKQGLKVVGSVVGYCRENWCITVLVDGRKHPKEWHHLFWDIVL